jgi:hypothetical protein
MPFDRRLGRTMSRMEHKSLPEPYSPDGSGMQNGIGSVCLWDFVPYDNVLDTLQGS